MGRSGRENGEREGAWKRDKQRQRGRQRDSYLTMEFRRTFLFWPQIN